jgi:hypothetical protein
MLAFAALAALMAMAFVGASSAMAESTALCNIDPGSGSAEVCPAGHLVTHIHEVTEAGNPDLLLSSVVTIKCKALFLGDASNSLANPLVITGHFTYSGCETASGSSCTFTETSTSSTTNVLKLGHELADASYVYEFNWHCGFFINCTYSGEGLLGHALGPLLSTAANGEVRIEEQTTHKTGGSLCPEIAKLDQLTTPLEKTYITN